MTDASFRSFGYVLMIENKPEQKNQSERNCYASVAFGSKNQKTSLLHNSKSQSTRKEFSALLEFAHLLWEATKQAIILTDNEPVIRFFQTKGIPPSLCKACDYVLQFYCKIAQIAGSISTLAISLFFLRIEAQCYCENAARVR